MEPRPLPRRTSAEMPSDEPSPNSSSTTRLTPESDSEEDSDLELGEVGESFKLQRRGKDVEKGRAPDENDENDDDDDEEGVFDGHQRQRRRASVSTVQSYQLYTPDEERAVIRKFDRKLVLFVALLYMLSFLDRSSTAAPISLNSFQE
jgi:hypothetical protein